jgi:hypothetical protein
MVIFLVNTRNSRPQNKEKVSLKVLFHAVLEQIFSISSAPLRPPLTMHWLSLLSVLAAAPIGLANPVAPRWDDVEVKHTWGSIPEKWEHHSQPHDSVTIDLRIALKPQRENALIDALYEVSDPDHQKCVSVPL